MSRWRLTDVWPGPTAEDGTLRFGPVDTGTRMRWSLQFRPRGALRLLTPLLPLIGRRQLRRVWGALEAYVEQQPQPRGPT